MESSRFDDLTRALAAGSSRRAIIKTVTGGMAGGVLSMFGSRGLSARGQDKVEICHKGNTLAVAAPAVQAHLDHGDTLGPCAEQPCTEGTERCNGACVPTCPAGQALDETCACACEETGEPPCGETCCGAGQKCIDGQCTDPDPCDEGAVLCGEACVPECPEGQYLDDACACACVTTGQAPCNGQCCDGTQSCVDGLCTDPGPEPCAEGTVLCGDTCVPACIAGQVLDATCTCVCEITGQPPCNGACCGDTQTCVDGLCTDPGPEPCSEGTVLCGDVCVVACPAGQVLDDTCTCVCETTLLPPCGDACCSGTQTCVDGQCVDPAPVGQCPERSVCGGRQYCNDEQTCICVETREGDLRCGQIPSCNARRCEASADCADLGEGYFCDVPDSGCCSAQVSLCLAPCEAPACPPERSCGATCCPEGQLCINGTCTSPNSCDGSSCFGGRCGSDSDFCLCTSSVEGIGFCMDAFKADCGSYDACSSSSECGDGLCLSLAGCCGGANLCVPASAACPSGVGTVRAWS